jgi:deoxyhypusine synthase
MSEGQDEDEFVTRKNGCTIFLGFTSNMSSSGVRDVVRFLAQHKLVDCIVTTAGGVEEDIMKCLGDTYVGDFGLGGAELRGKRVNRIANLLLPNDNYCLLQEWLEPILNELLEEQKTRETKNWTPSEIITRFGEKINDPSSFCYWAAVNKIPVFSTALTDGALGDTMYLHALEKPGLVIDIIRDIVRINTVVMNAEKTGVIILGAGLAKHHILNANLKVNRLSDAFPCSYTIFPFNSVTEQTMQSS